MQLIRYSEHNKLLAGPSGPERIGESYSNGHSSITHLNHKIRERERLRARERGDVYTEISSSCPLFQR